MAWYNNAGDLGHDLKKGAGGAAVGAATGAKVGSAFGPVGTVVGGVAGAVIGGVAGANTKGLDTKSLTDKIGGAFSGPKAPGTPQSPTIDQISEEQKAFAEGLKNRQTNQTNQTIPQQPNTLSSTQISNMPNVTAANAAQIRQISAPTAATIGQWTKPVAATIDTAPQAAIRQDQAGLIEQMKQQAAGTAPSVAQIQQQKGFEQALANQYALAASQPMTAGTMRTAARQVAELQGQQAVEGGLLRLQEQQAAQKALGEQLAGVRTSDIGLATQQAQLQQQAGLQLSAQELEAAAQQAQLQQQATLQGSQQEQQAALLQAQLQQEAAMKGYDIQAQTGLTQAQLDQALKIQQGQMGLEQSKLAQGEQQFYDKLKADIMAQQQQIELQKMGIQSTAETEKYKAKSQQFGGLMGAGAGALATYFASDINEKTELQRTDPKELDSFFKALVPTTYKYKDSEKHGPGKYTGFIAQEIERSNIGKEMVKEIDGVKMVDNQKLLYAMAAQIARLSKGRK